jgi:hypothetical protein
MSKLLTISLKIVDAIRILWLRTERAEDCEVVPAVASPFALNFEETFGDTGMYLGKDVVSVLVDHIPKNLGILERRGMLKTGARIINHRRATGQWPMALLTPRKQQMRAGITIHI